MTEYVYPGGDSYNPLDVAREIEESARMKEREKVPASMSPETRDTVVDELIEFFLEEFREDGVGVGDWLAQNGTDADLFYELVLELKASLPSPNVTANQP